MKHIKVKNIPDCRICGKEMMLIKWYNGKPTEEHPFGTEPRWRWECGCGGSSETFDKCPDYEYETISNYEWDIPDFMKK